MRTVIVDLKPGLGEVALFLGVRPRYSLLDQTAARDLLPEALRRGVGVINAGVFNSGLLADPTLGTGCVKVTPAQDPNDYACYQRNPQIGIINILNPDGTINERWNRPLPGSGGVHTRKALNALAAGLLGSSCVTITPVSCSRW